MNNINSSAGLSDLNNKEITKGAVNRFTRIDSIRGLAALGVAVGHSIISSPLAIGLLSITIRNFAGLTIVQKVLRVLLIIFNGGAAVVCFFVISGFVLNGALKRSYDRRNSNWIIEFYKKRIYRIYPALIVSYIFLGMFLDTSAANLSRDMLMISIVGNPVTWSLKVEMLMAILLPFVFLLFRQKYKFLPMVIGLLVFFLYKFNVNILLSVIVLPKFIAEQFGYFIKTSQYFFPFVLGMYGYEYYDVLKGYFKKNLLFLLGVFILLTSEFIVGFDSYYAVFIQSFAALVVVVGCNENGLASWLNLKPVAWLGKVSYSFYLYHPIVAYIFFSRMVPKLGIQYPISIPFETILTVGLAVFLGSLSYIYIEQLFLTSKR